MQIVTPAQMKKLESESLKYGTPAQKLMSNAGTMLADLIDEYCRKEIIGEPENKSIVFLAGSGNNGGDCFAAANKLVFRGYDITVISLCGKPKTKIAEAEYAKLPKDHIKLIRAYRSANVKAAIEAAELDYMTLSKDSDIAALAKKDKKELTSLEKIMLEEKQRLRRVFDAISGADVLADGVFGTGFHGALDDEISAFLSASTKAYKIAVDVPSGGNCETGGIADGAFKADETIAFGVLKTGMTQYPLKEYCGKITVVDIGIPNEAYAALNNQRLYSLIDSNALREFPGERRPDAYKNQFGRVLLINGSRRMRGAAVLSTLACLRSGAGLVCLASCEEACAATAVLAPEATFVPLETDYDGYLLYDSNKKILAEEMERSDAVLIGCGMGVTSDTVELVRFVVNTAKCPIIIDADGINCIASDISILKNKRTDIVITPHAGEMARLLGCTNDDVNRDRFAASAGFAAEHGVTVLLKGAGTLISDANYTAVNSTGNPGMSRGGSGDVLAGIVAAFAAAGHDVFDAAGYATYLHGLAGDITADKLSQQAMLPRDIIDSLSAAFSYIKEKNSAES